MHTDVYSSETFMVGNCERMQQWRGFIAQQNWGEQGSSADMLLPDIPNTREKEPKERNKLK